MADGAGIIQLAAWQDIKSHDGAWEKAAEMAHAELTGDSTDQIPELAGDSADQMQQA